MLKACHVLYPHSGDASALKKKKKKKRHFWIMTEHDFKGPVISIKPRQPE